MCSAFCLAYEFVLPVWCHWVVTINVQAIQLNWSFCLPFKTFSFQKRSIILHPTSYSNEKDICYANGMQLFINLLATTNRLNWYQNTRKCITICNLELVELKVKCILFYFWNLHQHIQNVDKETFFFKINFLLSFCSLFLLIKCLVFHFFGRQQTEKRSNKYCNWMKQFLCYAMNASK